MTVPLAPHEADLVEADARALYEQKEALLNDRLARRAGVPWERAPDYMRDHYREAAANPYGRNLV